jgi:hypothetical protein
MHRARRSWKSLALRPRLLIALIAAGLGLAAALWLPTRNDIASATENCWGWQQTQGDYRYSGDRTRWSAGGGRYGHHWQSPAPSADPSMVPPASEPPASAAPAATTWAPFTVYLKGQHVTFDGVEYEVKETHTSLPGWEPPALPILFKPLVQP